MKRAAPWEQSHPVSSDDSSDSDSDNDKLASSKHSAKNGGSHSSKDIKAEGLHFCCFYLFLQLVKWSFLLICEFKHCRLLLRRAISFLEF